MILTDFHKVSEADASFVFSCTKWLRRLLGTLRDLIKVHFACFRVVTDNFLPGSTDQWKWGQLAKSWGCQVFVPRSFSQRRFSDCLSDANYSFIIFLKKIFQSQALLQSTIGHATWVLPAFWYNGVKCRILIKTALYWVTLLITKQILKAVYNEAR